MDLLQSCANCGGPKSLIRLDRVPRLDVETPLSAEALVALGHWQAQPGEILSVLDPEATAYRARISCMEPGQASCVPFQRLRVSVESQLRIEVYLALPGNDYFEVLLSKLTELGVARIVPLGLQPSITPDGDLRQEQLYRWAEIINKTSRRCRRAMLPELMPVQAFAEMLLLANSAELKLMHHEGDVSWSFREAIGSFKPQSIALLIGPEGGFSSDDVEQAQAVGFLPISLGPRTLDAETAAVVAATLAQSSLGDLG